MRLCMFHPNDNPLERGWVGRVDGDRVLHLAAQTLQSFFLGGSGAREHAEYPLADVTFLVPVQAPTVRVFSAPDAFRFANATRARRPERQRHGHGVDGVCSHRRRDRCGGCDRRLLGASRVAGSGREPYGQAVRLRARAGACGRHAGRDRSRCGRRSPRRGERARGGVAVGIRMGRCGRARSSPNRAPAGRRDRRTPGHDPRRHQRRRPARRRGRRRPRLPIRRPDAARSRLGR